jgi:hypothetical protein
MDLDQLTPAEVPGRRAPNLRFRRWRLTLNQRLGTLVKRPSLHSMEVGP